MMMLQLLSKRSSTISTRLFLSRCLGSFFLLLNGLIGRKSPGRCVNILIDQVTGSVALLGLRTTGIVLSRRAERRRCSWLLLLMMMMMIVLLAMMIAAGSRRIASSVLTRRSIGTGIGVTATRVRCRHGWVTLFQ